PSCDYPWLHAPASQQTILCSRTRGNQNMLLLGNGSFKPSILLFAGAILVSLAAAVQAAAGRRQDGQAPPARALPAGVSAPDSYRWLTLDFAAIKSTLQVGGGAGETLALPMPDGGFAEFMLSDTGTLPAELAAKYPQIRSY